VEVKEKSCHVRLLTVSHQFEHQFEKEYPIFMGDVNKRKGELLLDWV